MFQNQEVERLNRVTQLLASQLLREPIHVASPGGAPGVATLSTVRVTVSRKEDGATTVAVAVDYREGSKATGTKAEVVYPSPGLLTRTCAPEGEDR
jgi:hypothetical protein